MDAGCVMSPYRRVHALPHPFPKALSVFSEDQKSLFFSGNHRGEEQSISAFKLPALGRLRPHLGWVDFSGLVGLFPWFTKEIFF